MTKTVANILVSIILAISVFLLVVAIDLLLLNGGLTMWLDNILNPGA